VIDSSRDRFQRLEFTIWLATSEGCQSEPPFRRSNVVSVSSPQPEVRKPQSNHSDECEYLTGFKVKSVTFAADRHTVTHLHAKVKVGELRYELVRAPDAHHLSVNQHHGCEFTRAAVLATNLLAHTCPRSSCVDFVGVRAIAPVCVSSRSLVQSTAFVHNPHKPSHTPPPTHRCARCAYGPAWPQSCQRSNLCVFFAGCTCSLFQPHAVCGQAKAIHSHAHLDAVVVFLAMFMNNHECVFQDTMATAGHGS
jgi:hypothetical protein